MVKANLKYILGTMLLIALVSIFFLAHQYNYRHLQSSYGNSSTIMDLQSYSVDGEKFYKYDKSGLAKDYDYDTLYFKVAVKDVEHLDKMLVIETLNTNINMYTLSDFFLNNQPIKNTNNRVTMKYSDINTFNLTDFQGKYLIFEMKKVDQYDKMYFLKIGVVSQLDLEKFIIKVTQNQIFNISIGIAVVILVMSMSVYKVYRQYNLHIILMLLINYLILYVSTTSYTSYFIYSNQEVWDTIQMLIIFLINTNTFYYVYRSERLAVRKLAFVFMHISYIITISTLTMRILKLGYEPQYTNIMLYIFVMFEVVLIIGIVRKLYFKIRRGLQTSANVKLKNTLMIYIMTVSIVINFSNIFIQQGIITNNSKSYFFAWLFLITYIFIVLILIFILDVLRKEYKTIPLELQKNNELLEQLNLHQNVLYSKRSIEGIIYTVFKNAEQSLKKQLSGYYLLPDEDGRKKIVQAYGKFYELSGSYYDDIKKSEKVNERKGWVVIRNSKKYEDIEAELCILPSSRMEESDLLILNTFFKVAYEVIINFMLLQNMFDEEKQLIYSLTEISEIRSKETGNHIKRVGEYCKIIGEKLGLEKKELELLVIASQMHDLGKLCIPDEILHKPGKLTDEEFYIIKTHAMAGYFILHNCTGMYLEKSKIIARDHHEKYNGSGYHGLKGEEIDLYGRIVAVADVFDALMSERSYKKAWELDRVVKLFKEERGEHFDPVIIDIFLDSIDEFEKIHLQYN